MFKEIKGEDMFHNLIIWIVQTVGQLGYPGIVALMFLESSFFPFPSEVIIPPAGYLASKGEMSLLMVIILGISGSLLGAIFNYLIAMRFGRPFLEKYGKFLLISKNSLHKSDKFFEKHGHISTFVGRLLPGIRQYISLPAGLSRMNFTLFCFYTFFGAGIWVIILAFVGFWLGNHQDLVSAYLHRITIVLIIFCILLIILYIYIKRSKQKEKE